MSSSSKSKVPAQARSDMPGVSKPKGSRGKRAAVFRNGSQFPTVALWLEMDPAIGYNLMRGITAYVRRNPRWRIPIVDGSIVAQSEDFVRKHADGLIAHIYSPEEEAMVRSFGIPVVRVAGMDPDLTLPFVAADECETGRVAARHLMEMGCKRALCVTDCSQANYRLRAEAFVGEARAGGMSVSLETRELRGVKLMEPQMYFRMLKRARLPVGVFAVCDRSGTGILEACNVLGLRVPEQVALITCNNDEFLCQVSCPPLTSIEIPCFEIGFTAAHLLDHLMGRQKLPPEKTVFPPGQIAVRESTDCISGVNAHLASALRFIREHRADVIYAKDVVEGVGVSRRTLETLFQKHLGRGIGEKLREEHLQVAEELLRRNKNLTVAQMAASSGFPNAACLDRAFHRLHGMSVRQYQGKVFCAADTAKSRRRSRA